MVARWLFTGLSEKIPPLNLYDFVVHKYDSGPFFTVGLWDFGGFLACFTGQKLFGEGIIPHQNNVPCLRIQH